MDKLELENIVREVLGKTMNDAGPGALTAANGGQVKVSMPLALALKLTERIEAKAAEWNMRVVTAVSDASGRPVAVHCMDGAYMGSFDVALNKTYTSIAFQMSTAELEIEPAGNEPLRHTIYKRGQDCHFRRRRSADI